MKPEVRPRCEPFSQEVSKDLNSKWFETRVQHAEPKLIRVPNRSRPRQVAEAFSEPRAGHGWLGGFHVFYSACEGLDAGPEYDIHPCGCYMAHVRRAHVVRKIASPAHLAARTKGIRHYMLLTCCANSMASIFWIVPVLAHTRGHRFLLAPRVRKRPMVG